MTTREQPVPLTQAGVAAMADFVQWLEFDEERRALAHQALFMNDEDLTTFIQRERPSPSGIVRLRYLMAARPLEASPLPNESGFPHEEFRTWRIAASASQREVGAHFDLRQEAVSAFERGIRQPPVAVHYALLDLMRGTAPFPWDQPGAASAATPPATAPPALPEFEAMGNPFEQFRDEVARGFEKARLAGLSLDEIADGLDVPPRNLQRWLDGSVQPPPRIVARILENLPALARLTDSEGPAEDTGGVETREPPAAASTDNLVRRTLDYWLSRGLMPDPDKLQGVIELLKGVG